MARPQVSVLKRQREQKKRERKERKAERRAQRKIDQPTETDGPPIADSEDEPSQDVSE